MTAHKKFDVLVLFGSTSDAPVYQALFSNLQEYGLRFDFEAISAHRNPDRLEERLAEEDYSCVIAGAGISAHLPGVIASKVDVPVYGIPVDAQFGGLDAVMSIQMMPRGVPVLMCGSAIMNLKLFTPFIQAMNLLKPTWTQEIEVCVSKEMRSTKTFEKEIARLEIVGKQKGCVIKLVDSPSNTLPIIQFVSTETDITDNPLAIHVPLLEPAARKDVNYAIICFEWTLKGGLWVGVNNSINALHFFDRALIEREKLPPVYHIGSVKNILGEKDASSLIFAYSDRYSIFDWGEMPDMIPQKGRCLASMAYMFFDALGRPESWQSWNLKGPETDYLKESLENLRQNGLKHHMDQGLMSEFMHKIPLEEADRYLSVHRVSVLHPSYVNQQYDYSVYQGSPQNALVPLEVIFRFGIPQGSSLMERIDDAEYLKEIGLSEKPSFGTMFTHPVIEFSTKLESRDIYISKKKARTIAGLNELEMNNLSTLVAILAYRLRDIFSTSELTLWDGKFEFAFTEKDERGNRSFQLVDSIGPDELRLSYKGVPLSKECLRKPYRGTAWHRALSEAKEIAKSRGARNWKAVCKNELKQRPEPLSEEFLSLISSMYTALSNSISEQLYGRAIFPASPNIAQVAKALQEQE